MIFRGPKALREVWKAEKPGCVTFRIQTPNDFTRIDHLRVDQNLIGKAVDQNVNLSHAPSNWKRKRSNDAWIRGAKAADVPAAARREAIAPVAGIALRQRR